MFRVIAKMTSFKHHSLESVMIENYEKCLTKFVETLLEYEVMAYTMYYYIFMLKRPKTH